jgi:nicotinamide riboside kinase
MQENFKKIVAVYGGYTSGKTTVINKLVQDPDFEAAGGLKKVRHITTRDYRENEVPEKDITVSVQQQLIWKNKEILLLM